MRWHSNGREREAEGDDTEERGVLRTWNAAVAGQEWPLSFEVDPYPRKRPSSHLPEAIRICRDRSKKFDQPASVDGKQSSIA